MNRFELWDKVVRCRLQQHFRLLVALWLPQISHWKLKVAVSVWPVFGFAYLYETNVTLLKDFRVLLIRWTSGRSVIRQPFDSTIQLTVLVLSHSHQCTRSTVHYIAGDDDGSEWWWWWWWIDVDDYIADTSTHPTCCVTAICRGCRRGCVQPMLMSSTSPACTVLIRHLCVVLVSPTLTLTSSSVVRFIRSLVLLYCDIEIARVLEQHGMDPAAALQSCYTHTYTQRYEQCRSVLYPASPTCGGGIINE